MSAILDSIAPVMTGLAGLATATVLLFITRRQDRQISELRDEITAVRQGDHHRVDGTECAVTSQIHGSDPFGPCLHCGHFHQIDVPCGLCQAEIGQRRLSS
ncbi:hypothetical protein [Nakamurella leprariae]|uniref:Uncharacterized protein n=1 Tax=Nakamurella leprariae TaxID=2803911 RepID=A0A938YCV8_9ACTN|nr:hypothetical protein [Nakamurella leprariae]MBM9467256.1 hypothetical protein [Nakamurella leprariae]